MKNNPLWLTGPDCGLTLFSTEGEDGLIEVKECAGLRWLHFQNGSVETVMSVDDPHRLVLDYIRAMMVILVFNPEPNKLLSLGLGGGAIHRFCKKHLPETRITTVEADANIIEICKNFFFLEDSLDEMVVDNAKDFLIKQCSRIPPHTYDAILVDLFCNDGIAPCLFEPDFYPLTRSTLNQNGIIVFNIIVKDDKELHEIFTYIWKTYGGKALCFDLEECNNVLVIAFGSDAIDRKIHTIYKNANHCCQITQVNFRSYVDMIVRCNGTRNGQLKFITG